MKTSTLITLGQYHSQSITSVITEIKYAELCAIFSIIPINTIEMGKCI